MFGLNGADRLVGGHGDDWLDGGEGADQLAGGLGDDLYQLDNRSDQVVERRGEGIDTILARLNYVLPENFENLRLMEGGAYSGQGNHLDNAINGNFSANLLDGKAGNDFLSGGAGDDVLHGGTGKDVLVGGPGHDLMTGGSSSDIFRFVASDLGPSTVLGVIADFQASEGDKMDIAGLGATTFIGTAEFTPVDEYGNGEVPLGQFRYRPASDGIVVEGDNNGDVTADCLSRSLG